MAQLYDDLTGRDGHCIRLIHLDGVDAESGRIHCRLETVPLQDAPTYWSLSYCWGDASDPPLINCNGFELPVTKNLQNALHRLLELDQRPPLWIDAISINQSDLDEKARQVKMMGAVYRTTQKVVIWLGTAEDTAAQSRALDLCRQLSQVQVKKSGLSTKRMVHALDQNVVIQAKDGQVTMNYDGPEHARDIHAVLLLLNRPWWKRIWIIQELALARDVDVIFGDAVLSWDILSQGITNYLSIVDPNHMIVPPPDVHHARSLLDFRAGGKDEGRAADSAETWQYLVFLLNRFRWSLATDRRDKVYGLLGLAGQASGHGGVRVTYTNDIDDIDDTIRCYTTTTVDIIKASRSLDILQLCWLPPPPVISPSRLKNLPSWAPDFSIDATHLQGDFVDPTGLEFYSLHARLDLARETPGASSSRGAKLFTAAKDSKADKVILLDPASVLLRGYAWDTITQTADASTDDQEDARAICKWHLDFLHGGERGNKEVFHELGDLVSLMRKLTLNQGESLAVWLGWRRLVHDGPPYPTGEAAEDVFYALVHDRYFAHSVEFDAARDQANLRRIARLAAALDKLSLAPLGAAFGRAHRRAMAFVGSSLAMLWPSVNLFSQVAYNRVVRTARGYLARVPVQAAAGDRIALLRGGSLPFVVRESARAADGGDRWELVGACYVHGIMSGEQWDDALCRDMVFV